MPEEQKEQKPEPWKPENVISLVEELGDRILSYLEKKLQHDMRMEEITRKSSWRMLASLLGFLAFIIALMVALTLLDKVSGDALLFLTGTIVGWILSIVYRHLFPTQVVYQE